MKTVTGHNGGGCTDRCPVRESKDNLLSSIDCSHKLQRHPRKEIECQRKEKWENDDTEKIEIKLQFPNVVTHETYIVNNKQERKMDRLKKQRCLCGIE